MAVDYAQIKAWDVDAIERFAAAMRSRIDHLTWLERDLRRLRCWDDWTGDCADAADVRISQIGDLVTDVAASAEAAGRAAKHLVTGLEQLKATVAAADSLATGNGFSIDDGGTVHDLWVMDANDRRSYDEPQWQRRQQIRTDLEQTVKSVLAKGRALEAQAKSALEVVAAGRVSDGGATTVAAAADSQKATPLPLLTGSTPDAVNAWWTSLDPQEQEQLIQTHPQSVGNLDGVPADVRDRANRLALPRLKADLEEQRDELRKAVEEERARLREESILGENYSPSLTAKELQLRAIEGQLRGIEHVEEEIDNTDRPVGGERRLLILENGGDQLLAAVAVGDVDRAKNVAVTTGGNTTNVQDSLSGMTSEAEDMRYSMNELSRRYGGEQSSATIAFLGYRAPQFPFGDNGEPWDYVLEAPNVSSTDMAEEGGRRLNGFLNGLSATTQRPDQHLTAFGHSYGSTTTSYALHQGTSVDDMVLYGSPGVVSNQAQGLNLAPGHGYYMETGDDPIQKSQWVTDLGGANPKEGDFTRLDTAPRTLDDESGHHEYAGAHGHSDYPRPTAEGQQRTATHNLAAIASGHPQKAFRP